MDIATLYSHFEEEWSLELVVIGLKVPPIPNFYITDTPSLNIFVIYILFFE